MSDKKEMTKDNAGVSPEEQRRAALLSEMKPALRKVVQEFRTFEAKAAAGNILVRYDQGEVVKKITDDEPEYGTNAIEQLAKFLGRDANDLYMLRSMVKQYSRAEVKEMAQKEMGNGGHIAIGHFAAIGKVGQVKDREALWKRVFSESLSVSQLATEVAAGYDKTNRSRGGGRPPSKPTSAAACVQEVYSQLLNVNNRFKGWDEVLFTAVDDIPPDKINANMLERFEQAVEQAGSLEENLTQYKPKLEKGLKRVQTVMEQKDKEEKAAKAEQKKEERALDGKGRAAGTKKVSGKKKKGSKRPVATR